MSRHAGPASAPSSAPPADPGAHAMPPASECGPDGEPPLEAKVRFLRSAAAHPAAGEAPECIETHMSWVFLSGDRVLKLKKPVRFAYLDFSTLERREFFCREEVRLNARLAPAVYLGLSALQAGASGWRLVPEGRQASGERTIDWLVRMRRLPADGTLSARIDHDAALPDRIDALVRVLGNFYRGAGTVRLSPQDYIAQLRATQAEVRGLLVDPRFGLRGAARALNALDAGMTVHLDALGARAAGGHLVDGHGDLRPEHVFMRPHGPPVVIDCLEFNPALRRVDPFDEIAYLGLECELAGAPWIGPRLVAGLGHALGDLPAPGLSTLYAAHRALLRAGLAIAHLLDPVVRAPQRWPLQAQRYVDHALQVLAES